MALLAAAAWLAGCGLPIGGEGGTPPGPPDVRVEPFTAPPATGPVAHVLLRNPYDSRFEGSVRLRGPEGWMVGPAEQPVSIEARGTRRVPFTIERARPLESNSYPLEVEVVAGELRHIHSQAVFCASAPRLSPVIDGEPDDWQDAIAVSFASRGKTTSISTAWDREHFYLLIEVEEESFDGLCDPGCDGLQIALGRRDRATPTAASDRAERHELLLLGGSTDEDSSRVLVLLEPEDTCEVVTRPRPLGDLELSSSRLAVSRVGGCTRYECAVPWEELSSLRPAVGREICLSLLVHDADGTGLRELSRAAGLWPDQRPPLAWCSWEGASWEEAPLESRVEWGLCSSKN